MSWWGIAIWLLFQAVWLVCAVGAAYGHGAPGIAACVLFLILALWRSEHAARDARVVLTAASFGFVAESLLVAGGLIRFSAPWPSETFAPLWMVALWAAFGVTVPALADAIGGRRTGVAALLGAVGGPLAYLAGARLGALDLPGPYLATLATFAAVWAAALVTLFSSARRHEKLRAGLS